MTYPYNADGIRTRKSVNGIVTEYLLNGSDIVMQKSGSDVLWFYGGGFDLNGTRYLYVKNAQGDITGITDAAGNLVVEYTYDSWGKLLETTGSLARTVGMKNPFRYRGYYYDIESGFYYVQSRYYDPETGRFLNADGVVPAAGNSVQGYNLFVYCMNNPVNMIDPTGNWPQWVNGVANWFNDNLVQPVKKFVNGVSEDIKNFDIRNQSEEKVLQSNYFSIYRGVPVIRINGNRSGSFGVIFLTRETNDRDNPTDIVRHEYGHIIQLAVLGVMRYTIDIAIPSWLQVGGGDYYKRPWEITADIYGGVQSRHHTREDIEAGFSYLEDSKRRGPFIWLFAY